jgi:hypothetical protein
MRKLLSCLGVLAALLVTAGCGSDAPPAGDSDTIAPARLGDKIDLNLEELLTRPRAELAEMADDLAGKVHFQQEALRTGKHGLALLPNLRLPLVVPVFRDAHYAAKAGFSLPPYATDDAKDTPLALHLARHGDTEAALKLVDPTDREAVRQIEAARYERNYPVEWTRLVGLLLYAAQLRLAGDEVDGGTEVVVLHRQLKAVLDPKASRGTLGALLLPLGKTTLAAAGDSWRGDKRTELAGQVAAALAEWGTSPPADSPLHLSVPRAEVCRLLRSTAAGRVVPAVATARAFDLWALPFPEEGAEAVLAGFDATDRLEEVWVTYRPGLGEMFLTPADLAAFLEERGQAGQAGKPSAGLQERDYRLGDAACDVIMVTQGAGIGALLRFHTPGATPTAGTLTRDFGTANLDRSFEQSRRRLAPEQRKDTLSFSRPELLAGITSPLVDLKPGAGELRREPGRDLVAAFLLSYPLAGSGPPPLYRVVLPLWAKLGPPQLEGMTDGYGGHLALSWHDARTGYTLRLPYESPQPIAFEAQDRQGAGQFAAREAAAHALDTRERKARLESGKPLAWIPRRLEQLHLGMTRAQVDQALPRGRAVLRREIPDGLTVTFAGDPGRTDTYVARQLFVRFDADRRVVDLRARYTNGPAATNGAWATELLKRLRRDAGAPLDLPSPWARLWPDLPHQKPAASLAQWQDDITLLSYQRDAGGVEVALRNCPLDHEEGQPLAALQYLDRGPTSGCVIGRPRDELLRGTAGTPLTTADGALVLRPAGSGPYDALFVWFTGDRASRIVARHAADGKPTLGPAEAGAAVTQAAQQAARQLGWPRRQDVTGNDVLHGLAWNDERTRVRLFWQEDDNGATRLFGEWVDLPSP